MPNFIVRIDHLSDQQLEFFGWLVLDRGDEFTLYWCPQNNETQPVSNDPPRYLAIDDWNDAQYMSGGNPIIAGPRHHN